MMEEIDPWLSNGVDASKTHQKCEFEDNFVDKSQKLPDSAEYVAALERKLSKLKKTGGCTKRDQQDLLNSIEDSHRSCMIRLIAGDAGTATNEDIALDTPVNLNSTTCWLKSHVNPEQPLTVGELVELVKADYLGIQNSKPEVKENPT